MIPIVIREPAIEYHACPGVESESFSPLNFMLFPVSQVHEGRQVAIRIETKMQFDRLRPVRTY